MTNIFKSVLYTVLTLSPLAALEIRPRVVGGAPDVGHEFPFAVMLQAADPPMLRTCSGSLIAPTWVLTAAHCSPQGNEKYLRVKYGDPTIPSNETKFFTKIIKAIQHPSFRTKRARVICDIGLLKIEKISDTPLAKLSAVDYAALMKLPVKYAGFGRTKLLLKGEKVPTGVDVWNDLEPPFLVGEAMVISCEEDGGGMGESNPAICVAPRCGPRQHAYFGDSGGPLVLNGRIIGVACGLRNVYLPIVAYTPVSPFLDWIYDTIHSN